jgi:methyl-accepting chemotaxis protein
MRFIHAGFQRMVILFGLSIGLSCLAMIYLADHWFFRRSLEGLVKAGVPADSAVYYFLNEQRMLMKGIFLVVLIISVVVSCVWGFILSNRVARPMQTMKEHFLRVAQGSAPTRMYFRKTDFFQEIADAYNGELEARGLLPKIRDESKLPRLNV